MRWLELPSDLAGRAAAAAVALLMLAICFEVVSRYVFNAPTVWAHELGSMLTGTTFVLGMSYALQRDEHIRVDLFSQRFGPRARAVIDLVGYAVVLLPITGWLIWTFAHITIDAYARGERSGASAWNPEIWPFRAMLCVGFVLFAIQIVAEVVKRVRVVRTSAGA